MTDQNQLLRAAELALEALTCAGSVAEGESLERCAIEALRGALSAPAQPASGEAVALPDFDDLDDEVIDNACTAGSIYRVDLMRAWESIRAQIGTTPPASHEQAQPSGEVHVGESQFEGWYEQHPKAIGGDKQLARDAYAAGMKDKTRTNQGNGKVFLVATGDVYDGEETYTRHAGEPPPLCDFELLYTAPQPVPIRASIAAIHQRLKFPHRPIDAHAISVVIAECETACPELCGITSNGATAQPDHPKP
jgi:hypothetical protein